jgi:hypothetical protein
MTLSRDKVDTPGQEVALDVINHNNRCRRGQPVADLPPTCHVARLMDRRQTFYE